MGEKLIGALDGGYLADLRAAYAAAIYLDQYLADIERRQVDFIEDQRGARLDQDGGFGFHWLYNNDAGRSLSTSRRGGGSRFARIFREDYSK